MNNIVSMALNLKTKNTKTEKITIKTIYFNTSEASCVQWKGKLQPYYEQLDNTASETKYQKANEYSQMKDRQDPTFHMYENNDQTLQDVIQEMKQINHLESKLPIVLSSKKNSNRHFKLGIGLLAACCCILAVVLISVAVTQSTTLTRKRIFILGILFTFIIEIMAIGLKQIKLKSKYQPEEVYENTAFSTTNKVETEKHDETEQPYYEDVDEDEDHKAKPNEYSEYPDKSQLYMNNESVRKEVLHENEVKHLETKLPTPAVEKCNLDRKWKLATIILAVLCLATGSALISVTTVMLLKKESPCENGLLSCQNEGECYVLNLKAKCACLDGFSGVNCSLTPCSSDPCQNSGKCTYSINSSQPACQCEDGYSGNNCQVTPCTNINCDNSGTCLITGNTSICECPVGISGELCQITPCTYSPCQNHGKCNVLESGYNCSCVDWFSGENCTDYMCDFESNNSQFCVFEQEYFNSRKWQRKTGSIASINGPTEAADGIFYNFLFAGYNPSSSIVRLVSRNIILDSAKCLTFKYYIYGLRLRVYINTYTSFNLKSNAIVNYWQLANIKVPVETKKVTFEVTFGYNGVFYPFATIDTVKLSDCSI